MKIQATITPTEKEIDAVNWVYPYLSREEVIDFISGCMVNTGKELIERSVRLKKWHLRKAYDHDEIHR